MTTPRFPDSAVANRPVWRSGMRGHLESWFAKGNEPASGRAYWLKYTLWVPSDPAQQALCETWAIVFDPQSGRIIAGKEERPIESARLAATPSVDFGNGALADGHVRGDIADDAGGRLRWDVRWPAPSQPLVPFAWDWMYRAGIPRSKTVSPHPDVRASGWIEFAGERWTFEGIPAMQGHNWGTEHAPRYAWGHCNVFEGLDGAWFEGFSARIRVAGRLTPPISAAVLQLPDGRRFAFNGVRALLRGKAEIEDLSWTFAVGHKDGWRLEGTATAKAEAMAGLTYRNPDAQPLSCLNSKVADLSLRLVDPAGRSEAELRSTAAAALETLTPAQDHPVRMRV
jgi:hypothetical protein